MRISIPSSKKVACITGSVWTGSKSAPRRLLVRDGFVRPYWFTTDRRLTDAAYHRLSISEFHLAKLEDNVLAELKYGAGIVGILRKDFEFAMDAARQGVLVVGPPEIAAQLAITIPQTIIFVLKDVAMDMSRHLDDLQQTGQLHRIDVNALAPGAWTEVYRSMMDTMGLQTGRIL
jgi:hypothetical protein